MDMPEPVFSKFDSSRCFWSSLNEANILLSKIMAVYCSCTDTTSFLVMIGFFSSKMGLATNLPIFIKNFRQLVFLNV